MINPRTLLAFMHDVAAAATAWLGAYWLSNDLNLRLDQLDAALSALLWLLPLQAVIFWQLGLYRGIWQFASLPDLKRILRASGAAALATALVLFVLKVPVPGAALILDPLLLIVFMGGSRMAYRAWKEHRLASSRMPDAGQRVLVAGAGSAADFLLRELARNPSGYRVVGLLDDAPGKIGRQIQGVNVIGRLADLIPLARQLDVHDIILALPSAHHSVRKALAETCVAEGINLMTVPSLEDLMQGRVSIAKLRPIELDDLLGRDPVEMDDAAISEFITGRVVLVTGAGGSIGAELCRQVARFGPARIVMLENSEYALYRIEQEFRGTRPGLPISCLVGDVKDAQRVADTLSRYRPSVVFHAAAYKHVPLMEEGNAAQALRNNVLGTAVLARAARAVGVEKFVLISTDKAVNPTNVMGASKRLAEMVCQVAHALPVETESEAGPLPETRFISVRFGNVLGSSGSVIPKFQQQIEHGGPVTVTHPEITRYFMSITEAAQLVMQAGCMGEGGEIFVLDMGEPVRIADLARLMIRLSGRAEDEIRIEYTGLRPGEKLYEELLADAETTLPTPHPKLRVAKARSVELERMLSILDWIGAHPAADDSEVRKRLRGWIPEYRGLGPLPGAGMDGSGRQGA